MRRWVACGWCVLVAACPSPGPGSDAGADAGVDGGADAGFDAGAPPDSGTNDAGPQSYTVTQYNPTLNPGFFTYPGYNGGPGTYACPDAGTAGYTPLQMNLFVPQLPAGQRAPLLLFFPGTYDDVTLDQIAGPGLTQAVTHRAAELGLAAVGLQYKSNDGLIPEVYPDRLDAKERCVFDSDISQHTAPVVTDNDLVTQLCENLGPLADAGTKIDCSRGILVAGHSQGSAMALMAKNYEPRVAAAYAVSPWAALYNTIPNDVVAGTLLYCYLADPAVVLAQKGSLGCGYAGFDGGMGSANYRVVQSSKVRAIAGDVDPVFINPDGGAVGPAVIGLALDNVLGLDCPATPSTSCAGTNGAGWHLAGAADLAPCVANTACVAVPPASHAGHCFFSDGDSFSCADNNGHPETWDPDPNYFAVDGGGGDWSVDATLRWMKVQLSP